MSLINAGIPVTLLEVSPEKAERALADIYQTYKKSSAVRSGRMQAIDVTRLIELVTTTASYSDLR